MELVFDNKVTLDIDLSSALTALSLTNTDIEDIAFVVKVNKSDTDANARLLKTLVSGGIVQKPSSDTIWQVLIDHSDFTTDGTGLETGDSYYISTGIKYDSATKYLELDPLSVEKLIILEDTIRS